MCVCVDVIAVSSDGNVSNYGDLELFLAGIDLSSFVPLFKQQGVSFPMFLRLTDSDLQKVCLDFYGSA